MSVSVEGSLNYWSVRNDDDSATNSNKGSAREINAMEIDI